MSALPTKLEKLAVHGGMPVRKSLLPYGRQQLDDADIAAVVEVLKSDWLTTGPKVAEFEERFAAWVGARHAVSFSSGTAALHATAFAAGLGPGDEAITTPMTFCATANCILYQGATPVFADVSVDTLNLDPKETSRKFTSRAKAIFAVDYAGHPAELDELGALAKSHSALLIEDASHALGAEYQGRRVGGIADMTVFSFHPVKHLTTGEGGMVTTNDSRLAETLRRFRNHGISSEARQRQEAGQWFYEMVLLGFNYRLTDIACALGLSQMDKLDANLARRRQIAQKYSEAFRDMPGIIVPTVREGANAAWHLYPIRLKLEMLTSGREEIFRALRAENIGVNVHYIPVHQHPYYCERFKSKESYPVADDAYERLISLPMFHSMTPQDAEDVIHAVGKIMSHYQNQSKDARAHLLEAGQSQ
jgi:UDP-4-amino-4,6-dideoxy-N-acetyl-beta-L-altrosamine transaminase